MSGAAEVEAIAERLREIAERLRGDLPDADAEALAREAADLVAKAGSAIDRASTPPTEGSGTP